MIVGIGLLFTVLFHLFTPEVKLSPTQKSSSFVYERLKPDRTDPVTDITTTDFPESRNTDGVAKPSVSYDTNTAHCHDDRQILVEKEEGIMEGQKGRVEERRRKVSWKDWLKEPQFYQVLWPFPVT